MFVVNNVIILLLMSFLSIIMSLTMIMSPMMNMMVMVTSYTVVPSPISSVPTTTIADRYSCTRYYSLNHNSNSDDIKNNDDESNNNSMARDCHRRSLLHQMITGGITIVSTTTAATMRSQSVNAISDHQSNNRLFQSNTLLTNPILEQLRIWEQAEADNIKYNGELERGDAGNKGQINAYPSLLLPILIISQDISYLNVLLGTNTNNTTTTTTTKSTRNDSYQRALQILSNHTIYDTIPFKRIFNAYADNVYYSDPDRANLYLGGGATPKSIQSLAYLLRNEILDNLDNLRAELQYQLRLGQSASPPALENVDNDEIDEEVRQLITAAYTAMQKYIDIIPPNELQSAMVLMQQK